MMPPSTSESHTFLPNSVVLGALPLRIMAVWGSKMETSFSVGGTRSPLSTLRQVCQTTRSRSPRNGEALLRSCLRRAPLGAYFAPSRLALLRLLRLRPTPRVGRPVGGLCLLCAPTCHLGDLVRQSVGATGSVSKRLASGHPAHALRD